MARKDKVTEALEGLSALQHAPPSKENDAKIIAALAHKSNHVVALAASIVAERGINDVAPALEAAFQRFISGGDPGCQAMEAIARALESLDVRAQDLFLAGIRHVQMEPVWGGQEDTAVGLRSMCATGIVNSRHSDAALELARLLADPYKNARAAAAHAWRGLRRRSRSVSLDRRKRSRRRVNGWTKVYRKRTSCAAAEEGESSDRSARDLQTRLHSDGADRSGQNFAR